jgi:hypothetical protein
VPKEADFNQRRPRSPFLGRRPTVGLRRPLASAQADARHSVPKEADFNQRQQPGGINVDNSYAQRASLTCPQCGRTFSAEVWLIVDADGRPDLVERIRAGTLHDLTCPHCGHKGRVDAPLLLLRPDATPPLLFSPAQRTTAEEDRRHAAGLVGLLRERMGPAWRDEWLAQGLPAVPRDLLPLALAEGWKAAQREMARRAEELQQTADRMQQEAIAARQALDSLSPEERARAVLERMLAGKPVALQIGDLDETLFQVLAAMRLEAGAEGERAERLQALEKQLQQMRQQMGPMQVLARAGALQALLALLNAPALEEKRHLLETNAASLLSDDADALLERLLEVEERPDARRFLEEHRALLRRCREVGIPRAFAEKMLPPEVLARAEAAGLTPEQALEMARLAAQMPPELREVLAELAASGVEIRSLADLERLLSERPDLREKMEQAVAEWQQRPADPLAGRFEEILALQERAENEPNLWPGVLRAWQELILESERQGNPHISAMAKENLALACICLYELTGDEAWAQQAEQLLGALLLNFRRETAPSQWAMTQHNLGNLFLDRYKHGGNEAHARRAETHYQNALEVHCRETAPSEWAMTQHALGNLFLDRYERSGDEAHARQAETHYQNALEVHCRETAPSEWAMTQHALGNLFLDRYERSGDEAHAQQAETHYTNALKGYPHETVPSRWAMVQYSLGNLFLDRYERSGDEAHAQQAETHYKNALKVRRRKTAPSEWANVQHSLGNLFLLRYERSGDEAHAQQAETHYQDALKVRRRKTAGQPVPGPLQARWE